MGGQRSARRLGGILGLVALVAAGCAAWLGPAATPQPTGPVVPVRTLQPVATRAPTSAGMPAAIDPRSGLPVVALAVLPLEVATTVARIEAGGPFPYDQDGATFENREGHLPAQERGYYREYTVETPGSPDRGARRIVTGRDGEMYWTPDHYDSFAWIAR